ncbi:hypothetical protein [Thermasporomyces composti]|uniref:hypothetical protein n=1 Tax=Thermasporomyces composti TaxID=696763 RepID=UPI000E250E3E|nr:hypothetical protein [Thermasporomyces composti]
MATLPHGPVHGHPPFLAHGHGGASCVAPPRIPTDEAPRRETPLCDGSVREALRARLAVAAFSLVASSAVVIALRVLVGSPG